jgi:hypothetical protein
LNLDHAWKFCISGTLVETQTKICETHAKQLFFFQKSKSVNHKQKNTVCVWISGLGPFLPDSFDRGKQNLDF